MRVHQRKKNRGKLRENGKTGGTQKDVLRYLGSILHMRGDIDEDYKPHAQRRLDEVA